MTYSSICQALLMKFPRVGFYETAFLLQILMSAICPAGIQAPLYTLPIWTTTKSSRGSSNLSTFH